MTKSWWEFAAAFKKEILQIVGYLDVFQTAFTFFFYAEEDMENYMRISNLVSIILFTVNVPY